MPPAQVTLSAVESRQLVEWEEFTGRVEATEMVELRPRVSGYITEVHFEAGALVKEGVVVKRGQAIGLVGETGLATGPHLHFELRRDGDALDPEAFLRIPRAPSPLVSSGAP